MPLDYGELKKKKNKRFGNGWSPDPGDNEIRVLPPTSKYFTDLIGFIAYEFRQHFVRLEGHDIQVFRCLRDFDDKCPACSFYYGNRNDEDEGAADIAGKFSATTRFALNIINMDDPDSGIQTYECGVSVHDEILKYAANEKWGDVLDPEEGRNFTVKLTPGSQNPTGYNQYDVMPAPNPSSVLHKLPEDWKEALDVLEDQVPERPSKQNIENVVSAGREQAFGDRQSGNLTPSTGGTSSDSGSTTKAQPEKSSGFSAGVSQPEVEQSEPTPTQEPGEPSASTETDSDGVLPPRVEGGPNIDPETDQPVCFGKFDREQYPCDNCDVDEECQVKRLGF